jgi:hypothetical protein
LRKKVAIRACCAALFCFLVLGPSPAFPQSSSKSHSKDYALIYGTVWGPDDRPVAGVPIRIRRATDKKPKWELYSDHDGEFAQRVPPGGEDYIIQADIKMRKGQPKPETTVHVYNDERQDVSLHLTKEELSHK